jgi:hypothetical protein
LAHRSNVIIQSAATECDDFQCAVWWIWFNIRNTKMKTSQE